MIQTTLAQVVSFYSDQQSGKSTDLLYRLSRVHVVSKNLMTRK